MSENREGLPVLEQSIKELEQINNKLSDSECKSSERIELMRAAADISKRIQEALSFMTEE